jgi:hypothetical protein
VHGLHRLALAVTEEAVGVLGGRLTPRLPAEKTRIRGEAVFTVPDPSCDEAAQLCGMSGSRPRLNIP